MVLDADAAGNGLQSELEQETLTPSAQDSGVDVSSSKDALTVVVAHEPEVEAETPAVTTTNDLAATELLVTEQPVMPSTEVFLFYSWKTCWLTSFYF